MKIKTNALRVSCVLSSIALLLSSCQKSDLSESSTESSSSSTIAVAVSEVSASGASTDSVYLMQRCGPGGKRDSIAQADLPAAASSYISANYDGATFHKAFAIRNSSSAVTGYVAVIFYNGKPVGLEFDSAGNFVRVLEQREKGDLTRAGHHRGGRFEHRDGKQRDTLSLSALPASIVSYLASNHAADTLVKAFTNRDNSIVVLSKNNGAFATVFTAAGVFIKREELASRRGNCTSIELSALPSAAASYLAQTYPNYVFRKAFSISQNATVKGYVVFIDANNTLYAVEFDASGAFVRAKTVR